MSVSIHNLAYVGEKSLLFDELSRNPKRINERDLTGWTPLHFAASRGHPVIVAMLLDLGADTIAKNRNLKTPVEIAASWGHQEVLNTFRKKSEEKELREVRAMEFEDKLMYNLLHAEEMRRNIALNEERDRIRRLEEEKAAAHRILVERVAALKLEESKVRAQLYATAKEKARALAQEQSNARRLEEQVALAKRMDEDKATARRLTSIAAAFQRSDVENLSRGSRKMEELQALRRRRNEHASATSHRIQEEKSTLQWLEKTFK